MSAWQVGDLALCVAGEPNDHEWQSDLSGPSHGPALNEVCRVTRIFICPFDGNLALDLEEYPEPEGWLASAFRKIKPDTEPCEEEFTVLIKRGRKVQA